MSAPYEGWPIAGTATGYAMAVNIAINNMRQAASVLTLMRNGIDSLSERGDHESATSFAQEALDFVIGRLMDSAETAEDWCKKKEGTSS